MDNENASRDYDPKELARRMKLHKEWKFGRDAVTSPVPHNGEDEEAGSMRSIQARLFGRNSPLVR